MRILLVDTDQLFTRIVKLKLEKWGHIVHIELSGEAAWEELERQAYRVVMLEHDLGDLDGLELCRRIRKLHRARYTYVLFYSANHEHEALTSAYQAGADDYLNKPFNPQLLRLRLKNGKRMLNLEDELRNVASLDTTTGFINHDTFLRFFSVYEAGARRYKYTGLLLFITAENFKEVFDEYGGEVANQLKSAIAEVMPVSIRKSDLVSNMRDDAGEFCIMMPYTLLENVGSVINRLDNKLKDVVVQAGNTLIHPRISYSTVQYPQEDRGVDEVMAAENRVAFVLNSAA